MYALEEDSEGNAAHEELYHDTPKQDENLHEGVGM